MFIRVLRQASVSAAQEHLQNCTTSMILEQTCLTKTLGRELVGS